MKFLADENIPLLAIKQLNKSGFDIVSSAAVSPGATDDEILLLANSEDRIVITFDLDFGNYVFKEGKVLNTGIILLRLNPGDPQKIADTLKSVLERSDLIFEGSLTVLKEDLIRQKPL